MITGTRNYLKLKKEVFPIKNLFVSFLSNQSFQILEDGVIVDSKSFMWKVKVLVDLLADLDRQDHAGSVRHQELGV